MALHVYTTQGCFGSTFPPLKIGNVYARPIRPPGRSVSPETCFDNYDFPYSVADDFNIHNPAVDPFRIFSSNEERESAPYFDKAADSGFFLPNIPGTYTHFPFPSLHSPSAIDLAFANPHMSPALANGRRHPCCQPARTTSSG